MTTLFTSIIEPRVLNHNKLLNTSVVQHWLKSGCKHLVLLGDSSAAKTTRMGDSDLFRFSEAEEVQEG